MKYYFIVSKRDKDYILDSIFSDYKSLRYKFPDKKIYYSDKPLLSIYIEKKQLHEIPKQNRILVKY